MALGGTRLSEGRDGEAPSHTAPCNHHKLCSLPWPSSEMHLEALSPLPLSSLLRIGTEGGEQISLSMNPHCEGGKQIQGVGGGENM